MAAVSRAARSPATNCGASSNNTRDDVCAVLPSPACGRGVGGEGSKMIRAVIFDLFDTLLYLTNAIVEETRRDLAIRAGVDPDAWAALWRGNVVDRMLGRLGGLDDEI